MLNITLKTANHYIISEEISAEVIITNTGSVDSLFRMPTTSSGKLVYDIFLLTLGDNAIVPYHGMIMKSKDLYIPISVGETISFVVALTREYLINKEGNYTISFNDDYFNSQYYQTIRDTVINVSDEQLQPMATWYQISSSSQKLHATAVKSFSSHKVHHATDIQFRELKEAHNKAYEILENVQRCNGTLSNNFEAPYKEMFCINDTSMWPFVYSNLTHMKFYMDSGMKYHFNNPDCSPRAYGYVYPADLDKNIYLCRQYEESSSFPSKDYRYDTKAGTIIHEVSHKAVSSKDHFYSYDGCKIAAASCITSNTTTNADCLQIFSELSFLSGISLENDEL